MFLGFFSPSRQSRMCPLYRRLGPLAKGSRSNHGDPSPPGASASGAFLPSRTEWKQPGPGTLGGWLKSRKQTNKQTNTRPGPAFLVSKERAELLPAPWLRRESGFQRLPAASSGWGSVWAGAGPGGGAGPREPGFSLVSSRPGGGGRQKRPCGARQAGPSTEIADFPTGGGDPARASVVSGDADVPLTVAHGSLLKRGGRSHEATDPLRAAPRSCSRRRGRIPG